MTADGGKQLMMFHFRCPLCGAEPKEVPLVNYLKTWSGCDRSRAGDFAKSIGATISACLEGKSRWMTKKATRTLSEAVSQARAISGALGCGEIFESLQVRDGGIIAWVRTCVVCGNGPGERRQDSYFTMWQESCKVQMSNLLYEGGLVLWAILKRLPDWADGKVLETLNVFRGAMHNASLAIDLMECPQCKRPTSCIYGEEETGRCRWCLDLEGPLGLSVSFSLEAMLEEDEFWRSPTSLEAHPSEEQSEFHPETKNLIPPPYLKKGVRKSPRA